MAEENKKVKVQEKTQTNEEPEKKQEDSVSPSSATLKGLESSAKSPNITSFLDASFRDALGVTSMDKLLGSTSYLNLIRNQSAEKIFALHGTTMENLMSLGSNEKLARSLAASYKIPTYKYPDINPKKVSDVSKSINDSETEIVKLKQKLYEQTEKEQDAKETIEKLLSEQKIYNIKTRINEKAVNKLSKSPAFLKMFDDESTFQCVVISIDIRRSTELMLKAKTPVRYAKFISSLSDRLSGVIKEHYGIFDKFTGDGILAFFPDFYSGDGAILRAWDAAQACHALFKEHYSINRDCFTVYLTDIGLGIGIDYGQVSLVNDERELTVVGIPVVYACRFSSAPAGFTYLNQPAIERIAELHGVHAQFYETKLTIKNEGDAMAYVLSLNRQAIENPNDPDWSAYEDNIDSKGTVPENGKEEKK